MSAPLAYVVRNFNPPDDLRPAAVLTCAKCSREGKTIIAGMNQPDKIQKMFIRLGWDANVHKASQNICPICVKQRAIRAETTATKTEVPTIARRPGLADNVRAGPEPVALGSGTRSPPKGASPSNLKELTNEQKGLLRTAIESYFNPDTGRWEADWNDHRVSEKLDIPRKIVMDFREMFYGELKEDPQVKAFADKLEQAKTVLSNLQSTLNKMELDLADIRKKTGL